MFNKNDFINEVRTETFSGFLATREVEQNGTTVIDWRAKTGSGVNSIQFLMSGNTLVVTGDLGDAVFCLTEAARLDRVAKYDIDYLLGKMSCGTDKYRFDEDDAFEVLDTLVAEHLDDHPEDADTVSDAVEDLKERFNSSQGFCSSDEAVSALCEAMQDFCPDWIEETLSTAGRHIAPRVYMWHTAIRMAWEQLSVEEQAGRYLASRLCEVGRIAGRTTRQSKLLEEMLSNLEDDDVVLSPACISAENIRLIDGIIDDGGSLLVFEQDGQPAKLLGKKRQYLYHYDEAEREKDEPVPSDCVPYFVDQHVGCCEDDYYGTMYFILDRIGKHDAPEQSGPCKVLLCPYEC